MADTKRKPNADTLRKIAELPVLGGRRLWPWALMRRNAPGVCGSNGSTCMLTCCPLCYPSSRKV